MNCDEDTNKAFCGRIGVQGFPTLKLVTPSKKRGGKPITKDYQGARSAKAIADTVIENIPNHVKKLTDKDVDGWISQDKDLPKVILFTEKGTTSALIRALAIDFLDGIKFAQIRNKELQAVRKFGVENFPTLVLLPVGGGEAVKYDGELKKNHIVQFLSQAALPNPYPSSQEKDGGGRRKPKPTQHETKGTEKSSSHSHTAPADVNSLATPEALEDACLTPKSVTCILALLPVSEQKEAGGPAKEAIESLKELQNKHLKRKPLPIYTVPTTNQRGKVLRNSLGLGTDEAELIAVNGRRGWWSKYDAAQKEGSFGVSAIKAWFDAIKLGEGTKKKLPKNIISGREEKKPEPEPENKQDGQHDEL